MRHFIDLSFMLQIYPVSLVLGPILNSSQVKIKYEFSKPFHSKSFSKDGNHAESEQFL